MAMPPLLWAGVTQAATRSSESSPNVANPGSEVYSIPGKLGRATCLRMWCFAMGFYGKVSSPELRTQYTGFPRLLHRPHLHCCCSLLLSCGSRISKQKQFPKHGNRHPSTPAAPEAHEKQELLLHARCLLTVVCLTANEVSVFQPLGQAGETQIKEVLRGALLWLRSPSKVCSPLLSAGKVSGTQDYIVRISSAASIVIHYVHVKKGIWPFQTLVALPHQTQALGQGLSFINHGYREFVCVPCHHPQNK